MRNRRDVLLGAVCSVFPWSLTGPAGAAEPVNPVVRGIKVLPDRAPDCSSLKAIVRSVTRDCTTNDQRAIAIYNFMMLSHYHRQYPGEAGGIPVLKEINTYGWSLCGGLHSEQSALWRELGWEWRFVGWDGHTTVEAKYDGQWHYLDVFLKFYAWRPDAAAPGGRTIASQDDLTRDPQALIADAFVVDKGRGATYMKDNAFEMIGAKANWAAPDFLTCGDTIPAVIAGLKTHKGNGSPDGWMGINHATGTYSADVDLPPGTGLTNTWAPLAPDAWFWGGSKTAPGHTCGNKDLRNDPGFGLVMEPYVNTVRGFANGTLIVAPDFGSAAVMGSFAGAENARYEGGAIVPARAGEPARVTVQLRSPYVMTKATAAAADGADAVEVSTDGGKTFKPTDGKNLTAAVKGQVAAQVRVTTRTALRALRLEAVVQNNPGSLPYLSPGRNVVSVSVADPAALGENNLVVTYAYAPGYRARSFEQLCNEGKEIAKQHNATWADAPTVVQKTFAAKDLPATFTIDVPTPKGKYPVYPRMMFVRREVVAPGAKPLPLPANARPPEPPAAADELKELPNPFMIGTQAPPARVVRATRTAVIPLKAGPLVTRSGDPAGGGDVLRWPKSAKEKVDPVALLIGGELTGLPAPADLAAARLVFPAVRAHPSAPTKVAVAALSAPFAPGDAKFDFAKLGDPVGTAVVPKQAQADPDWAPPREFKVDVTRAIRAISAGDAKFNGLALRVLPDRGTDEGWTVRVQLPKEPAVRLEVDTYLPAP